MSQIMTKKQFQRQAEEYDKVKIKCKCGSRLVIPVWVDKQLCRNCGKYVYRNKQLEFREKLVREMKRSV